MKVEEEQKQSDGETRGNRQSCAAVISKAEKKKKPTELKRWWGEGEEAKEGGTETDRRC